MILTRRREQGGELAAYYSVKVSQMQALAFQFNGPRRHSRAVADEGWLDRRRGNGSAAACKNGRERRLEPLPCKLQFGKRCVGHGASQTGSKSSGNEIENSSGNRRMKDSFAKVGGSHCIASRRLQSQEKTVPATPMREGP